MANPKKAVRLAAKPKVDDWGMGTAPQISPAEEAAHFKKMQQQSQASMQSAASKARAVAAKPAPTVGTAPTRDKKKREPAPAHPRTFKQNRRQLKELGVH